MLGTENAYEAFGGFVAGNNNTISGGNHASVAGGEGNTASVTSPASTVDLNTAIGNYPASEVARETPAVISSINTDPQHRHRNYPSEVARKHASVLLQHQRGSLNTAIGNYPVMVAPRTPWPAACISGGRDNSTDAVYASVSGGSSNTANNESASVSGQQYGVRQESSISGGAQMTFPEYDWSGGATSSNWPNGDRLVAHALSNDDVRGWVPHPSGITATRHER